MKYMDYVIVYVDPGYYKWPSANITYRIQGKVLGGHSLLANGYIFSSYRNSFYE